MCGINGIVDFNKVLSEGEINNILQNFNNSLTHRGPDDSGKIVFKNVGLGHTRLSIIDLSKNGKQPMYDKNNEVIISYNGEIYNFLDLKKKYFKNDKFYSNTDTEVILKLYSKVGMDKLIGEINGMYAFCILDKKTKKIYLSRDKIGKKPIYYYFQNDFLIWSSELNSFRFSPIKNKLEINEEGLRNYFDVGYIPSPLSVFKNINKLLPGETLEIDLVSKEKKSFFFELKNERYELDDGSLSNFENILEDSIKIRTISDVPYGVFLSSGIDSSLVASILSKIKNSKISSFSIGIENDNLDESKNSKKIAQSLGLDHNELIIKESDLVNTIPKMINTYSEPFADSSQIPTYLLSQFCKKKITVALSGDGGDEIFGGYNRYVYYKQYEYLLKTLFVFNKINFFNNKLFSLLLKNLNKSRVLAESIHKIETINKVKNVGDYYKKMISQNNQSLKIYKNSSYYQIHYLKGANDINAIKMMQIKDISNYLPDDILTKVDRASMAHSLEVRCPLLDKRLHKFIGLDEKFKMRNNKGKSLLRDTLSKYLDINLISKTKMGFAIPLHKWLTKDLNIIIDDLFNSNILREDSLLNQNEILKIWKMTKKGNTNFSFLIWSVLIYLQWKETWQKSA